MKPDILATGSFEKYTLKAWEAFLGFRRTTLRRFLGTALIGLIGFALAAALHEWLQFTIIPIISALLMSLFGGIWIGLPLIVIFASVIDYYYIPPIGEILGTTGDRLEFIIVIGVALLGGMLSASLRYAFFLLEQARQDANMARLKAEKAVRARDEVVGVISHELKNPLTALQTGVALIQRTLPENPENERSRNLVERLNPPIRRMGILVSDLLDVTQLEAHALKVEPRPIDLNEIIQEVARSYEALARNKQVDLKVSELLPKERQVLCDPVRTYQIMANLVNNAVKFAKPGGFIRISAELLNNDIRVEVFDTGKEVRREDLTRLFDRFWQAKDTAYQGTGLGLAIAKGLVEAQGGKIWAESLPGVGTSFHFTLPRARGMEEEGLKKAA